MFSAIKHRLADVKLIARLCTTAEEQARALGQASPGSEHFVIAALESPDGSAGRVFQALGIDPAAFRTAIDLQFHAALTQAGISLTGPASPAPLSPVVGESKGLYKAEPSVQVLMQRLAASKTSRGLRALVGADVLLAVSQEEFSIAIRTFRQLGISAPRLAHAVEAELSEIHFTESEA